MTYNYKVIEYPAAAYIKDPRSVVLDDAKSAVLSDRNAEYGPPENNFRDIAELWNAWLHIRFPDKYVELDSLDVAQMMIQVKQARMLTSPAKADHHIDIAGYAACGYSAALSLEAE